MSLITPKLAERELSLIRELGPYLGRMPITLAYGDEVLGRPLTDHFRAGNFEVTYWSLFRGYDVPLQILLHVVPTWSYSVRWATTFEGRCLLGPDGFGWRVGLRNHRHELEEVQPLDRRGACKWRVDASNTAHRYLSIAVQPHAADSLEDEMTALL